MNFIIGLKVFDTVDESVQYQKDNINTIHAISLKSKDDGKYELVYKEYISNKRDIHDSPNSRTYKSTYYANR